MFFKAKSRQIAATQSGECVGAELVPDPVFSEGILGECAAIIPCENEVHSPIDGEIVQVFDSRHAYTIRSRDGLEILVHVGQDTAELHGEGFCAKVKKGQQVKRGELLCVADIGFIREKGYEVYTMTVVTNSDELKSCNILKGKTVGGETAVIEYVK